ncbi:MAG: response regulator transcription factor [Verrucomicrobia bacterium]|nr:response regulator transcription factor [Verrucomicrobiota bacterium]
MKPITILLAEDHLVVRQGLRALLSAEGDFRIVAEAETGREAVELTRKLRPEIVIMDFALPVLNGAQATREILKAVPATRVLILSAYGDDAYVDQVIAAGAAGYLLKQSSLAALAHAIREVQAGRVFFSPAISKRCSARRRESLEQGASSRNKLAHLSPRELEVLQLVADGATNKKVAAALGISVKTVEKHRHSLMEKHRVYHTAGLTRYAIAQGIIESSVQANILPGLKGKPAAGGSPRGD